MKEHTDGVMIIPALMPEQFSDIEKEIDIVAPFASWVQLDVMDGTFVPATSWPYGNEQWHEVEQLAQGIRELPQKGKLHYEAHLMVSDPERIGELLARGGVERIIVHVETLEGIDVAHMCSTWRAAGATEIGLAIRVDSPIELLSSYAGLMQFIQVMGIERVGFQGETMNATSLPKVIAIRSAYPHMPIEFDGGVNMRTIADVAAAGVSRIVVGSALFGSDDPQKAYTELTQAVDN